MEKNDGLIFDLDGTLWNASPATTKGWNIALKSLGATSIHLTVEDIERVTGNPVEECVAMLLPHISRPELPGLIRTLEEIEYKMIKTEGGELYEGVQEGIRKLSQHYHLYLVSNCQEWYLECFFSYSKLRPFFHDWDCHGVSQLSKGEMIKNMIHRHQLSNPVYLGDTGLDEEASQATRIEFGYAAYGFGEVKECNLTFSSFKNLSEYFLDKAIF